MIARIGVVTAFSPTGQAQSTGLASRPPNVAEFYHPMTSAARSALATPSELTAIQPAAASFTAQQAAQSAALAMSAHLAAGAFGNSAAPPSVGPTTIVAATPSVAVPGVTSVLAPAAAIDPSQVAAAVDSGSGPAGGGPSASSPAAPVSAVSATAPAAAPAAKAGLTTTEVVAIAAGVLGIAGFLLVRRGKKRR